MRCPFATWVPSPNYNRGRSSVAVDRIVIHHTDGQPRLDRAVEHLCNPNPTGSPVSAHFVIGQAGEIVQLVDIDNTAWHCSGWNKQSVGIEHVARTPGELGHDDPGLPLTVAQLASSARLVRWLLAQMGLSLDSVVPHCSSPVTTHRDCGRADRDGGIWPWVQYRKLVIASSLSIGVQAEGIQSSSTKHGST